MLNLREYQSKAKRLADYLPWACLVAPGIILNKDGSLQRILQFRGPDLESSTEEELVAVCARINNALKRLGSGWALFCEATRIPASGYPERTKWRDPVAWLIDEERRGNFEQSGALFESAFFLTFVFLPPPDNVNKISDYLIETPDEVDEDRPEDIISQFTADTDKLFDLFSGVLPEVRYLNDEETLTYLKSCVSARHHPVRCPETPVYLDALLGTADLIGGLEPILDGQHLRVISIQGFPPFTEPGFFDALNNLGFPYRWTTRFLPMDKAEANKTLGRYRRQWFAKRKSVMAIVKEVMTNEGTALVDTDADNQAADADAAMQSLGQDHVGFGYFTASVVVNADDSSMAEERIREVERIINGRGYVTIRETVNAVDAWLGTLPGQAYANVRQPIVHTLNLAHMMPLSATWAGPPRNDHLAGPPLLHATTASHTPFRMVTHEGDVGHTLIVGPTGAGKSVLLSLIAAQFRRYQDAQVYIFDKGASAKIMTLAMNGDHFELGGETGLCFQPLVSIDQPSECAWAIDWIIDLFANEGVVIDPDIKETIWSALTALSNAPQEERTLTGLSALLQSSKLRQALAPYTLEGAHGSVLDADSEELGISDWQCFEMEELMNSRQLVLPVLTYLFHRLERRFDGKPALLILDEAWVFLDHPLFAGRIREWLKVLRKRNVSVIFATQSLADVTESKIATSIIESCPIRIFLPNPRALEPQQSDVYAKCGLNKRQIEIIASATPKQDYYFQSGPGNRLFDLTLGPVAKAFCASSSKDDLAAANKVSEKPEDFGKAWLNSKGFGWAANLLESPIKNPETTETGDIPCAAE